MTLMTAVLVSLSHHVCGGRGFCGSGLQWLKGCNSGSRHLLGAHQRPEGGRDGGKLPRQARLQALVFIVRRDHGGRLPPCTTMHCGEAVTTLSQRCGIGGGFRGNGSRVPGQAGPQASVICGMLIVNGFVYHRMFIASRSACREMVCRGWN